jgi:HSP20 family protein
MREQLLTNREQMREELLSNRAKMREAFLANRAHMHEDLLTNLIDKNTSNQGAYHKLSPRYQITDNAEKFEISIDVPGVNLKDISIDIDESNNMLKISGQRQQKSSTSSYSSSFSKSFSLGHTIDTDKVTASLVNGVLIVSAPRNVNKAVPDTVRKIPINVAAGGTTIRTTAGEDDHTATEQAVPINNNKASADSAEVGPKNHADRKDDHDVDHIIGTHAHAGNVNESNKQHLDDTQIENLDEKKLEI